MDIRAIADIFRNRTLLIQLGIAFGIFIVTLAIGIELGTSAARKIETFKRETGYERKRNLLLGNIQRAQAEFDQYQKRFPPTTETVWLMNQITQLAESVGLQIISIQPEKLPASQRLKGVAIRVVLECTYNEIGALVAKIESSDIFLRIQELIIEKTLPQAVTQQGRQEIAGKARVELVAHTFWTKDQ